MSFQGTKINPKFFSIKQIKWYIILVPMSIFMLLPVVFIISQAFKPLDELFMFPPSFLVKNPTLDNFTSLFRTASTTGVPMSRYLFNSIVVTLTMMALTIFLCVITGYVLSKKQFKAKNRLLSINQLALMFVPTAVVIPRYFVIVNLGLNNNFLVQVLPYLAMPVGLFLVKQFIDQIPDSLIEAARIDGANDFKIIYHLIVPLTKPALATVAILTFQFAWGSTEASSIFIQSETKQTFAFYLSTLTTAQNSVAGAGMAAAAGLIMFLPNLVIFIIMQSRVMSTMSHSGIK